MQTIADFPFFPLQYDGDGKPTTDAEFSALEQHVSTGASTDVIFIAHGFRNSAVDATGLYTRFFESLRQQLQRPEFLTIASRTYAVAGILWPSKSFKETDDRDDGSVQSVGDDDAAQAEAAAASIRDARDTIANADQRKKLNRALALLPTIKGNAAAQKELVGLVLSLTDDLSLDPTEGLDELRARDGADVLTILSDPIILPTVRANADEGGVMAMRGGASFAGDGGAVLGFKSFVGGLFGAVGKLLNVTTWYAMKSRGGTVGANGVADAVRRLKGLPNAPKVHLVGHSLGGRLMASCAKSLSSPLVQPDSLTLLEAAFSHYGFSAQGPSNPEGFFRPVITAHVVTGPTIATFSAKDTVVGLNYAVASRLAGDNTKAIGDANDQYGGIGRNGAQQCDVAVVDVLHRAGTAYQIPLGKVVCLDGSDGLINDHSDITNEHVTYAFASALMVT